MLRQTLRRRDERPAALDAGFVRAYAACRHSHAEWRAGVARWKCRSAPSRFRRRPILVQGSVRATVAHLVREIEPDVVGLSVMTFQRETALRLGRLGRPLAAPARG